MCKSFPDSWGSYLSKWALSDQIYHMIVLHLPHLTHKVRLAQDTSDKLYITHGQLWNWKCCIHSFSPLHTASNQTFVVYSHTARLYGVQAIQPNSKDIGTYPDMKSCDYSNQVQQYLICTENAFSNFTWYFEMRNPTPNSDWNSTLKIKFGLWTWTWLFQAGRSTGPRKSRQVLFRCFQGEEGGPFRKP